MDAQREIELTWDWLSQDERDMVLSTLDDDGWEMWEVLHSTYWREGNKLFINDVAGHC